MQSRREDFCERYDDLIIGAGSSGAVIASRLSEDPSRRVLLLEAGPDFSSLEEMPAELCDASKPVLRGYHWSVPALIGAEEARGLAPKTFNCAVGKLVGGTSSVNAVLALRGMPQDYEEWAAQCGGKWSWPEVLSVFRALENDPDGASEFHGRQGPVAIRRDRREDLTLLQQAFMRACLARDFPETADHNDPASTGVGVSPKNVSGTTRLSTALAYLQAARRRPNLTILSGVHVHRILWKASARCDGVEAGLRGEVHRFFAERVVVCAGALHTPAILMRSGIGDPVLLARLGIEARIPAAGVGACLGDHPLVMIWGEPKPRGAQLGNSIHQVLLRCRAGNGAHENNLHIHMVNAVSTDTFPSLRASVPSPAVVGISACLMKPTSHGWLRIRSADPYSSPQIVSNCLGSREDMRSLKEGVKMAWDLLHDSPMQGMIERVHGWTNGMVRSDAALEQAVSMSVHPSAHFTGTARMGLSPEAGAVVDPSGRVFGADNLWVADASIMPTCPRAPTNLTCIMIGEKIAAEIRKVISN